MMVRSKPRIDRDQVLRMEARRRAVEACIHCIPDLLHPDEAVGAPLREGDRIVMPIVQTRTGAVAVRQTNALA